MENWLYAVDNQINAIAKRHFAKGFLQKTFLREFSKKISSLTSYGIPQTSGRISENAAKLNRKLNKLGPYVFPQKLQPTN